MIFFLSIVMTDKFKKETFYVCCYVCWKGVRKSSLGFMAGACFLPEHHIWRVTGRPPGHTVTSPAMVAGDEESY